MALKPTIFKCRIALSNLDSQIYDTLNLTIAQHPSETVERMVVRILAYCLNASDTLEICKGLSNPEEPDLWARNLSDGIDLWIDVGEPTADRIKKACRVAGSVKVYSFNSKAETWWGQGQATFRQLNAEYFQFPWEDIQALAATVQKTMDWSVTISENSLYVSTDKGDCEVHCLALQSRSA